MNLHPVLLRRLVATTAVLVLLVAACSSSAGSSPTTAPGSASPPAASASPSLPPATISSPEAAAARVKAVNPSLEGIDAENPDLIGGCCFWEAVATADGYEVTFEVGWGDCPSGCIDRHRWTYAVSQNGGVELVSESGPEVPSDVPGGGGGSTGNGGGGAIIPGGTGIEGHVLAGPTCPVVTLDDASCNDRPVAGATILVLDVNGREVARLTTDADGHYAVALPAGPYTIEPQPVDGFLRVAESIQAVVGVAITTVDISFDTGIR